MIQVSILRRDFPGNGQRILPQDSTPLRRPAVLLVPLQSPCSPSRTVYVSLFQPRARQLLFSPSLGNCYRTIQPRMQIAALTLSLSLSLSRVSRMTFDEIRFPGKEKETRMSLSSSPAAPPSISASDSATYFSFRIPTSGGTNEKSTLRRLH